MVNVNKHFTDNVWNAAIDTMKNGWRKFRYTVQFDNGVTATHYEHGTPSVQIPYLYSGFRYHVVITCYEIGSKAPCYVWENVPA